MKPSLFILMVLGLSVILASAMDRFDALSQIESHDNDHAVGLQGEVSRYQILPEIWAEAWAGNQQLDIVLCPTNPVAAKIVANWVMQARCSTFETRYHREPDDFEFYILWHRPACYIGRSIPRHISAVEADRARRFASLCQNHEAVALR